MEGIDHDITTGPTGDFCRLLVAGKFPIKVIPDPEGRVLVIHYYTKRDPTNLALIDKMIKIFCISLSPLKGVGLDSTSRD